MVSFGLAGFFDTFVLAAGAQKIAGCHAETVSDELGKAQDHDHLAVKSATDRAGNYGEGGHATIYGA
jgi:hypothetical protein